MNRWVKGRLAHADEIRRKATAEITQMRNNVAPKIRPGWVAMEKYDRHPLPCLDIADLVLQRVLADADVGRSN